jgi:hypothetical protein
VSESLCGDRNRDDEVEDEVEEEREGEEKEGEGEVEEVVEEMEVEEVIIKSTEKDRENELRRASRKAQQDKMTAYLLALCLQKKKEEEDMKKQEERKKKSFLILSLRLQNEATEKKLMGKEDKFQYRSQVAVVPISEDPLIAILHLKSLREKEKERRMCHKDKERDKEKKDRKKEKNSKEMYDSSDKEGDSIMGRDSVTMKKDWSEKGKSSRMSQEATEAMISRLISRSKARDEGNGRRRSGVVGGSGSGTECVAARDFNDWKKKNAVPPDAEVCNEGIEFVGAGLVKKFCVIWFSAV